MRSMLLPCHVQYRPSCSCNKNKYATIYPQKLLLRVPNSKSKPNPFEMKHIIPTISLRNSTLHKVLRLLAYIYQHH